MKTVDLPVGSCVAYNYGESRNYPTLVEAYVFAHRERQHSYSYWGNNGNHDTVGVAYRVNYYRKDAVPEWQFKWVRPQTVICLWSTHIKTLENKKKEELRWAVIRAEEQADRKARLEVLPTGVTRALDLTTWEVERLADTNLVHCYLSVEKLEELVKVVYNSHPATIQDQIHSAMALL